MARGTVGRGLGLAISLLLIGVASGDVGHALAGLEGHGLGSAVLETDALSTAPDSAPPHDATNCLLCRAARVSSLVLSGGGACTPAVATESGAISLPETLAPSAPQRRAETARAPPARLAV